MTNALLLRLAPLLERLRTLAARLDRLPGGLVVQFMVLFAVVRGAHLAWSWGETPKKDAAQYDHLAQLIVQGEPWLNWISNTDWQFGPIGTPTAVRTPGLPLFLAPIYAVFGHEPDAGRAALVLLNAVAAGALFLACRRLWGVLPAIVAALWWTFWPVSVRALYYVDSLLAESLALPLVIFAVLAFTYEGLFAAALGGLALGAGMLTRPHLALSIPVLVALGLFALPARAAKKQILLGATVACLCLVPWAARNYATFGSIMPLSSQGGLGTWIGWAEGTTGTWNDRPHEKALVAKLAERHPSLLSAPEPEKSRIYSQAARESLAARGVGGILSRGAYKAWLYLKPTEHGYGLHLSLLVASLLALLARRSLWSSPASVVASAVWLGLFLTSVVTFYLGRYRFVGTPALLFLSAAGLAQVGEAYRRWLARSGLTERALGVAGAPVDEPRDGPRVRMSG